MTLPQSALEQPRRPNHTTLSQLYGLTGGVVRRHRTEAPFRAMTQDAAVGPEVAGAGGAGCPRV